MKKVKNWICWWRFFVIEDMIPDEEVAVTISHLGYIKRTKLTEYKSQGRGGVGSRGQLLVMKIYKRIFSLLLNHDYMLFFTEQGRCFWLRVFEIPEETASKGRAIQNMINIPSDDKVMAFINTKDLKDEDYTHENNYVVMCTKKDQVKTSLESYSRLRQMVLMPSLLKKEISYWKRN